jgi:two-component system, LytTR family, response regulator
MLQAIIVDDELKSRNTLHRLIDEFCEEVAVVDTADSVDTAVKAIINHTDLDVLFLDIELNKEFGFNLLNRFKEVPFEVIFTSARQDYALKAIKHSAIDYLLKPLNVLELQSAVNKVREKKSKESFHRQLEALMSSMKNSPKKDRQQIALSTQDGLLFVNVADILRCQADGSYTYFHLKNGLKVFTSGNLKEYEALLTPFNFFRIHHSFLINMAEIKKYVRGEGGYVIMSDDFTVDVSKRKKEAFLAQVSKVVSKI